LPAQLLCVTQKTANSRKRVRKIRLSSSCE
jgi:hypothetical protein